MKTISIHTTIATLVKTNPEVIDIMISLGFTEVKNPLMLSTVGKIMTLAKGAKMKKIPMDTIRHAFLNHHILLEENHE